MNQEIENEISKIVDLYLLYDGRYLDQFLTSFTEIYNNLDDEYENLKQLISASVLNKRHKEKLSDFTIQLMHYVLTKQAFVKKISKCKTFDELQIVIYHANLHCDELRNDKSGHSEISQIEEFRHLKFDYKNFGELAVYDTALYIGYPKFIFPDRVFLYPKGAGKGAGYLKLLNFITNTNITVLNHNDFPDFIRNKMECYHIENFLCVKKNDLEKICKNCKLI